MSSRRFPNEVLQQIFKDSLPELQKDCPEHGYKNTLSTAMVCRQFNACANPWLYGMVVIHDERSLIAFMRTLLHNGPALASCVKTFKIHLSHDELCDGLLRKANEVWSSNEVRVREAVFNASVDIDHANEWLSKIHQGEWNALVALTLCLLPNLGDLQVLDNSMTTLWFKTFLRYLPMLYRERRANRPLRKLLNIDLSNSKVPSMYREGLEATIPWLSLPSLRSLSLSQSRQRFLDHPLHVSALTSLTLRNITTDVGTLRDIVIRLPRLKQFIYQGVIFYEVTPPLAELAGYLSKEIEVIDYSVTNIVPAEFRPTCTFSKFSHLKSLRISTYWFLDLSMEGAFHWHFYAPWLGESTWVALLPASIEELHFYAPREEFYDYGHSDRTFTDAVHQLWKQLILFKPVLAPRLHLLTTKDIPDTFPPEILAGLEQVGVRVDVCHGNHHGY